MMLVDKHNVFITRNGPERAKWAVLLIMHGAFVTQAFEVALPAILFEQEWITDIDIFDRKSRHIGQLCLDKFWKCGVLKYVSFNLLE